MLPYFLLFEVARLRQQEMLQQAEAGRLYKQLKRNRPGLLKQIGGRLLAVAQQGRVRPQSNPITPVFSKERH